MCISSILLRSWALRKVSLQFSISLKKLYVSSRGYFIREKSPFGTLRGNNPNIFKNVRKHTNYAESCDLVRLCSITQITLFTPPSCFFCQRDHNASQGPGGGLRAVKIDGGVVAAAAGGGGGGQKVDF